MKNEYNDQELLYLIADGNETASSILYDKYNPSTPNTFFSTLGRLHNKSFGVKICS